MLHKDRILKEIISNDIHLIYYNEGIAALEKSRIFEYLRCAYVPTLYAGGANVHITAAQGAFSAGYNKCLDDILDFKDSIIEAAQPRKELPRPDYGGLDAAVENKHLTQEEADELRRGNQPKYDFATGKLKPTS